MVELAGRCKEYRQAASSFFSWLSAQVPPAVKVVDDIPQKAKEIVEKDICLPAQIYKDLCTCIRVRKNVHHFYTRRTRSLLTMKDRRHERVISILKDARKSLEATLEDEDDLQSQTEDEERSTEDSDSDLEKPQLLTAMALERQAEQAPPDPDSPDLAKGTLVRIISTGTLGLIELADNESCNLYSQGGIISVPLSEIQDVEDELPDLYGQTVSFQAACLLLDLEEIQHEITAAWEGYRKKQCSLLCATAISNFAVRHASSLANGLEMLHRDLFSIQRIVVAAYFLHVVQWVQQELRTDFAAAMALVTYLVFGNPHETVLGSVLHGILLAMARLDMDLVDTQLFFRARDVLLHRWGLSMTQADQLIDLVADNCCTYFCQPATFDAVDDFLVGRNGLVHTSDFLGRMADHGFIAPPSQWIVHKPGYFGPEWDEETPAVNTRELISYAAAVIPALLYCAFYELRHPTHGQMQVPELKFDTLMPLWPLLQQAILKGFASSSLVFAMHAMLLSTVKVNGDRRCKRIAITTRACFERLADQLARDESFASFASNCGPCKLWVDQAQVRLKNTFEELVADKSTASIAVLQRDYALLLNPWVAGQQQLVAVLAVGIGFGASVIDSGGQIRFVLHLYNALRAAQVIQPLEMLELLMTVFADSKVWHAGRPEKDFMQQWFLSVGGMSGPGTAFCEGKLPPIDPAGLSSAYCHAAANKFADWPDKSSLKRILEELRSSFDKDVLIGHNLTALGAYFRTLPETMIHRLHLHDEVSDEQVRRDSLPPESRELRDPKIGAGGEMDWLDSAYCVLARTLLAACDKRIAMAAKHGPTKKSPLRLQRGPLSEALSVASEVLTAYASLDKASYTLPC